MKVTVVIDFYWWQWRLNNLKENLLGDSLNILRLHGSFESHGLARLGVEFINSVVHININNHYLTNVYKNSFQSVFISLFSFFSPKLSTWLGSLEKRASKAAATYVCQMYLALLFLPWPYTGFGEWQFTIVSLFLFFQSLTPTWIFPVKKGPCIAEHLDVAGSCLMWMEVKEWKKKTRSGKNVQRHPVGNVHIPASEFHRLCAQWISGPDWQPMALNSSSLQWLRRIPALSRLSSHPDSSTAETHAFYFLLDTRSDTGQILID